MSLSSERPKDAAAALWPPPVPGCLGIAEPPNPAGSHPSTSPELCFAALLSLHGAVLRAISPVPRGGDISLVAQG